MIELTCDIYFVIAAGISVCYSEILVYGTLNYCKFHWGPSCLFFLTSIDFRKVFSGLCEICGKIESASYDICDIYLSLEVHFCGSFFFCHLWRL